MMEKELFNTEQKALDIAQKIKAFTFLVPTDCGIADPSYKRYLVTCSRLLELDVSLNGLQNDDEIEYDVIECQNFDDPILMKIVNMMILLSN